ncbi:DEAD/DEAH box helicase family protein (plasmid) [Xanthomonas citri pv. citri]|uniref:helicase-related protein n=1 Tax=Xanthomonas citri TaxID=346 RepID=UPI00193467A5|nr:helicase-related protein [Xanthomonas citri]QRD62738.1 DEAD/DEAH box helicase family protein [Xanthomonas citri pv. citri]QRD67065.1 DEAD/DEAH box helicase family protein [Xanthomonas citri pv. citri]QRD71682.1 DEAD/DEAH box helicase family protein [Xanthomonas citri pv. citri]
MATPKQNNVFARVGKLAALGVEDRWQTAIYLPESVDDITTQHADAAEVSGEKFEPVVIRLVSGPNLSTRPFPMVKVAVEDRSRNQCQAQFGGDADALDAWMESLKAGQVLCVLAKARWWRDSVTLQVKEVVEKQWYGRLRPNYKGRPRGLAAPDLRRLIHQYLDEGIPEASNRLIDHLKDVGPIDELLAEVGCPGWSLTSLFQQAHRPRTHSYWEHSIAALTRLDALAGLHRAKAGGPKPVANPYNVDSVERRLASAGLTPTGDQTAALAVYRDALAGKRPSRVMTVGDVGTGKSVCIFMIAAGLADQGGRTVCMFPNSQLAVQMLQDFRAWAPDLRMSLVTGDSDAGVDLSAPILIGTTALLNRKLPRVDAVLVDEQHRFARAQREKLVSRHTHLFEFTATAIPRTEALVRIGLFRTVELRQTFAPKKIVTQMFVGSDGRRALFNLLAQDLQQGGRVLVVYPRKNLDDTESVDGADKGKATNPMHTVEGAMPGWQSKFGERVAAITSESTTDEKVDTLAAFGAGEIQVLVCTTVVEVGLNLPTLYRIVIVDPTRYGLATLHQLRGRVARKGGQGYCELLCDDRLKQEQQDRLEFFCSTTDGFEIAARDLELRGAGDLGSGSDKQSGADYVFLIGRKLTMSHFSQVLPIYERRVRDQ